MSKIKVVQVLKLPTFTDKNITFYGLYLVDDKQRVWYKGERGFVLEDLPEEPEVQP